MTGCSAPAFKDTLSLVNGLLIERPLAGPAAAQIIQCVVCWRQCKSRCRCLLDHDGLWLAVLDGRRTGQNAGIGVDLVEQGNGDCAADVFQRDLKRVCIRFAAGRVVQHEVAIAVGKGDLQGRLLKQPCAPSRVLFRCVVVRGIEGCPLPVGFCRRDGVRCADSPAPVNLLQFAALIHTKGIRCVTAIAPEYRPCSRRGCAGRLRLRESNSSTYGSCENQ